MFWRQQDYSAVILSIYLFIYFYVIVYSSMMGMVTSSYDIAAMILTPLISYIGGSRKKPVFCAWGVFTMGVGFFIFMLPHFLSPPYEAGTYKQIRHRKKKWQILTTSCCLHFRCHHEFYPECKRLRTLRGKSHLFWREKWLQRRSRR